MNADEMAQVLGCTSRTAYNKMHRPETFNLCDILKIQHVTFLDYEVVVKALKEKNFEMLKLDPGIDLHDD